MSHRRVFGVFIFIPRKRRDVPRELAEASGPAPHPRPSSIFGGGLGGAGGQSTVAAQDGQALLRGGGVATRRARGVLGEEALDELELFLLFPQEDVDQELLLSFQLLHDRFGDVGDHPGNHEAEEHHQVLRAGPKRGNRWMM